MEMYRSSGSLNTSWGAFMVGAMKVVGWIIVALLGAAVIVGLALLMGFPVKWCWNYVMPMLSKGYFPEIGFWHAVALTFLCQLFFKGSSSSSNNSRR